MNPMLQMSKGELQHFLVESVPHNQALGLQVVACGEGHLVMDLPYAKRLVGNPLTGAMHEGAIISLIDTVCGSVVLTRIDDLRRTATLDLRVDFLRDGKPDAAVRCEAEGLLDDRQVATIRAVVHDGDRDDPVAWAVGTFAIFLTRRVDGSAE